MTPAASHRRAAAVTAAVAFAAVACKPSVPPSAAATAAARPRPLLVTIVVDQLSAWEAAERLPELPPGGGFARLREGTWVRDLRYGHAVTETSPGHAALYTGRTPRENGVYANDRPVAGGGEVPFVLDPLTRLVDVTGPTDHEGVSLSRLRRETLADRLRARHPAASIVAMSIKDRGAVFAGGRRPDVALWYDHGHDAVVTSTAFSRGLPDWVEPLAGRAALARRRQAVWRPLDAAFLARHLPGGDEAAGEGDYLGLGTTFPHAWSAASNPPTAFRAGPAADELVVDLAVAALDAEGRSGEPALLALSLSGHDYVGHVFGVHSWESWDHLLRLDGTLARLFGELDRRFGSDGWSAMLTADHGIPPLPELPASARAWCAGAAPDRWRRPCSGGGRLDETVLLEAARQAATAALGEGAWLASGDDQMLYLSDAARGLPVARRARLDARVVAKLQGIEGVLRAFPLAGPATHCPPGEQIEALVCRSIPRGGPDYYVVLEPGWSFLGSMVPGFGSNHGSPHLYDRAVPLLVRAPGRVPAGLVVEEPVAFTAFARTAASLLELETFAPHGRDLTRLAGPRPRS